MVKLVIEIVPAQGPCRRDLGAISPAQRACGVYLEDEIADEAAAEHGDCHPRQVGKDLPCTLRHVL